MPVLLKGKLKGAGGTAILILFRKFEVPLAQLRYCQLTFLSEGE
jgi:hypothetical protein